MTELTNIFFEGDYDIQQFSTPEEIIKCGNVKWIQFPTRTFATGVIFAEPNDMLKIHMHDDQNHGEFYFGLDGTISIPTKAANSSNSEITLEELNEGQVALIPPKSSHGMYANKESRVSWTFVGDFTDIIQDYHFDPDKKSSADIQILTPSDEYGEDILVTDKLSNLSASFVRVASGCSQTLEPIDFVQFLSVVGEGFATFTTTGKESSCQQFDTLAARYHAEVLPQARVEIKNTGSTSLLIARQIPSGRFPQPGVTM